VNVSTDGGRPGPAHVPDNQTTNNDDDKNWIAVSTSQARPAITGPSLRGVGWFGPRRGVPELLRRPGPDWSAALAGVRARWLGAIRCLPNGDLASCWRRSRRVAAGAGRPGRVPEGRPLARAASAPPCRSPSRRRAPRTRRRSFRPAGDDRPVSREPDPQQRAGGLPTAAVDTSATHDRRIYVGWEDGWFRTDRPTTRRHVVRRRRRHLATR